LKYLVISALVGLGFLLIYSRLRPYIQVIRKILSVVNPAGEAMPRSTTSQAKQVQHKLIQCAACHTWVPVDRSIGGRSGLSSYCSTECLEKAANDKKQKLAG